MVAVYGNKRLNKRPAYVDDTPTMGVVLITTLIYMSSNKSQSPATGRHTPIQRAADFPDLARDLRELLIIAHRVTDETDRRKLADIAEKWLRKLPVETN